jgi:hypothetical protein
MKHNVVFIAPGLEEMSLAEGRKHIYEKELIYCGDFCKGDMRFSVGPQDLHHWARTAAQFRKNGIDIPMPVEHSDDPEKRRASILSMHVKPNKKGVLALFGRLKFDTPEAEQILKNSQVSIFARKKWSDGLGRQYVAPITHVAFTDYPVIPALDKFEAIAASFSSGTRKMPLSLSMQTLAERLGVLTADKNDDQLEAMIVEAVKALQDKVEELDPDAETDVEEVADEVEEVAASFGKPVIDLVKDSRATKIDLLLSQGKIIPAIATKMKTKYASDENVLLALSGKDDGFDEQISLFAGNESVISFREKSGGQGNISLSSGGRKQGEKSILEQDAEDRAAAAAK